MALNARLRIVLMADDVVVAESDDSDIWLAALGAIRGVNTDSVPSLRKSDLDEWVPEEDRALIRAFAKDLDIPVQDVLTACHPRAIPPYIFPSKVHWELFKRSTAERGRSAVSNIVLALTLVLLWGEKIHLQPVSLYDANAILQTISVRDEHPARAVKNCPWLVFDPKTQRVHLNANQITRAIAVARAFCLKQAPQWDAGKTPSEAR
jgi:hypothetical protein